MANLLSPDALTTLANLKAALSVTVTTNDDYYQQVINRATQWIEGRTNRKLKARQYNGLTGGAATLGVHTTTKVPDEDYVYFSGLPKERGGDTLLEETTGYGLFYLPAFPVQLNAVLAFNLAALTLRNSSGETWDSTTLVENQDYLVDRDRGILRKLGGAFTLGVRNYRVTMAAGYQTVSNDPYVPYDLEDLCVQVAKRMILETNGLKAESLGSWTRDYDPDKQNAYIEDALGRYYHPAL